MKVPGYQKKYKAMITFEVKKTPKTQIKIRKVGENRLSLI